MTSIDMIAIRARYDRALEAKPSKGEYTPDDIAKITDSVCDIPDLLREVRRLTDAATPPPSPPIPSDDDLRRWDDLAASNADYIRNFQELPASIADTSLVIVAPQIVKLAAAVAPLLHLIAMERAEAVYETEKRRDG